MYKRLYTFFNVKIFIYGLQLRFRQQYSKSYVLLNITVNIRIALDDRNIGYGVFVNFQKVFSYCRPRDLWSFK